MLGELYNRLSATCSTTTVLSFCFPCWGSTKHAMHYFERGKRIYRIPHSRPRARFAGLRAWCPSPAPLPSALEGRGRRNCTAAVEAGTGRKEVELKAADDWRAGRKSAGAHSEPVPAQAGGPCEKGRKARRSPCSEWGCRQERVRVHPRAASREGELQVQPRRATGVYQHSPPCSPPAPKLPKDAPSKQLREAGGAKHRGRGRAVSGPHDWRRPLKARKWFASLEKGIHLDRGGLSNM